MLSQIRAKIRTYAAKRRGQRRQKTGKPSRQPPRPFQGFKLGTYTAVLGAVLGAVLAAVVIPWIQSLDDAKPLSEQLSGIRSAAAERNMAVIVDRRIDLQRSGQSSYLFVFRHRSLLPLAGERFAPVSDDIQIYTPDRDGQLKLEFNFQPRPLPVKLGPQTIKAMRDAGEKVRPPVPMPLTFYIGTIRDLDGDDRPELLGAFFKRLMVDELPIPVVIAWDDTTSSYRLFPLLRTRPKLRHLNVGLYGRARRTEYTRPVILRDNDSGEKVSAFEVEGYGIAQTPLGQPAIITTYVAHSPSHAEPKSFELDASIVSYTREPRTRPCPIGGATPLDARGSLLVNLGEHPEKLLRYSGYFGQIPMGIERKLRC